MLYPIQIYFLCGNAIMLISDTISNDIQKFFSSYENIPYFCRIDINSFVNHRVVCVFI